MGFLFKLCVANLYINYPEMRWDIMVMLIIYLSVLVHIGSEELLYKRNILFNHDPE